MVTTLEGRGRAARGLIRVTSVLAGWGGVIMTTIGSILIGLSGFDLSSVSERASQAISADVAAFGRGALLIVGIASVIVGLIMQITRRPTYAQLIRDKEASDTRASEATESLEEALASLLRRIATYCELDRAHQRVSIYCMVEDRFVLLARHSKSNRLSRRGRDSYPHDEGVIGEAWDLGESSRREWPADPDQWGTVQTGTEKMPADVVRRLTMRPRSMMAIRLTHDHRDIGVLVMESEQPRGVGQRQLELARTSLLLAGAAEIMVSAHPHFPSVAKERAASS